MKRHYRILLYIFVPLVLLIALYFSSWRPMLPGYHAFRYTPEKYVILKQQLQADRRLLKEEYQRANTQTAKTQILKKANRHFIGNMKQEFPFWYGTRWNFNGITQTPGEGSIACGYFVSTTLQDAGVKLNRFRLAQSASEKIVKSLTSEQYIRRFSNVPLNKFVKAVQEMGEGMYVVGLDSHVGFLLCENNQVYFIHSSGFIPWCVLREKADYSWSLAHSQYRVVGSLSNPEFISRWLTE
jgi:hypothetical protein